MHHTITVSSVSDSSTASGYTPDMIKRAYNLGNIGNGNGISCAVIDFLGNPYLKRNLEVFSDAFNLTSPDVFETGQALSQSFDFSAYIEPCVDSQWLHAISPLARINVIKAPQYSVQGALYAIETALEIGSDIVLLTFQAADYEAFLDRLDLFKSDAVFVTSAGDYGAEANFPACIPECISVGGTALEISDYGERLSEETVWEGSGGGICELFGIPDYQRSMLGINSQTQGRRGVPDVSFLASPNPGFAVFHSSAQGSFGWYSVGGTSVSASIVAGIIANILSSEEFSYIEKREVLPELYRLAGGSEYKNEYGCFVDIISGSNGGFYAQKGYDLCTGLGSLTNL